MASVPSEVHQDRRRFNFGVFNTDLTEIGECCEKASLDEFARIPWKSVDLRRRREWDIYPTIFRIHQRFNDLAIILLKRK